ncbi:MAG: hypothetical protein RR973_03895, partial [Anaerovoracaceae bacterium]
REICQIQGMFSERSGSAYRTTVTTKKTMMQNNDAVDIKKICIAQRILRNTRNVFREGSE